MPDRLRFSDSFARDLIPCSRGIDADPSWKSKSAEEILTWLAGYGAVPVGPGLSQAYLAQFAAEFERIPEVFRKAAHAAGGDVHLLQGMGVSEDPSWPTGVLSTFDGRTWATVPGAGGSPYLTAEGTDTPTRFVINRLYEGHGSVNLVLHEFAHSLDAIRRHDGFSGQAAWQQLTFQDSAFRGAMSALCASYCSDHSEESFAESFAVYYACPSTQQWLERRSPQAADWIGHLAASL